MTGGNNLEPQAELYDPVSRMFTPTAGLMLTARAAQTATLLPNGKVLIAGGRDASANATASAEIYDPSNGTFSPTGPMTVPRALQTATLLLDGEVLITGGWQ